MTHATLFLGYVGLAVVLGFLGRNRKFGFWGYMFASIALTPILGLLLVLASDSRPRSYRKV